MGNIYCRGPLRGTRNIGRSGPLAEFDTDGDVEIVQNLETLQYGVESRILLRSRVLVECGTNEAGGRGNVARKS